jgi:hypothetical protein
MMASLWLIKERAGSGGTVSIRLITERTGADDTVWHVNDNIEWRGADDSVSVWLTTERTGADGKHVADYREDRS